jgi:hypothetical protein
MSTADDAVSAPRQYRRSVLRTAFKRTWDSSRVFITVTVVNAIIQSLLIAPKAVYGVNTGLFIFLSIVSFVVLLAALTLITGAALRSGRGISTISGAYAKMRHNLLRFIVTALILTVAAVVGTLFWSYPGYVVVALTPYVLIAAAEGDRHVLIDNFRAIKYRFGRYLVVLLANLIILSGMFVGAIAITFLVGGPVSALLIWLYLGFVASWLLTGWALLWRSTPPGEAAAQRYFGDRNSST